MSLWNPTIPIELGSRLELFLDDKMIEHTEGTYRRIHHPIADEIVMTLTEEHEHTNNSGSYNSIIFDGEKYLFYYRANFWHPTEEEPVRNENVILCVAVSTDGIHFTRPQLNILKSGYNAVLDSTMTRDLVPDELNDICASTTTVFYDENPACPAEEKYKMLVTNERPPHGKANGIWLYISADGYHFTRKGGKFALPDGCGYDSANRAFYDHTIGKYRVYQRQWRICGKDWGRTIVTHCTEDFVTFTDTHVLEYDAEFESFFQLGQNLYTNNVAPYFRAPHILLGFPKRYVEWGPEPGVYVLPKDYDSRMLSRPDLRRRTWRARHIEPRAGTAVTDTVLMTSRDGVHFKGFGDSYLMPPPQDDSCNYGSAAIINGMMVTKSAMGHGAPDELSFLVAEGIWNNADVRIRRYHTRIDGFVSMHFKAAGGSLYTPVFIFDGGRLALNIECGAFGGIQVEIRDDKERPYPGFGITDALMITGNDHQMIARWRNKGSDLRELAGKPVELRIFARDCDLYSMQFIPYEPDPEIPEV